MSIQSSRPLNLIVRSHIWSHCFTLQSIWNEFCTQNYCRLYNSLRSIESCGFGSCQSCCHSLFVSSVFDRPIWFPPHVVSIDAWLTYLDNYGQSMISPFDFTAALTHISQVVCVITRFRSWMSLHGLFYAPAPRLCSSDFNSLCQCALAACTPDGHISRLSWTLTLVFAMYM